jgi:hypothetical protein
MLWMLPLAMGALGAVQANDQQKQQKAQNMAAAEHNRYSNFTGRSMDQRFDAPSALQGAMQGGIGGLGMAQSFGGLGSPAPQAPMGGMQAAGQQSMLANSPNAFGQSANSFFGGSNPYSNMRGSMLAGR